MSNGYITVEQAQEILRGKPADEQIAFLYAAVINLGHTCEQRPAGCDRRYVSKQWLKERKLALAGVIVGWVMANGFATWGVLKLVELI